MISNKEEVPYSFLIFKHRIASYPVDAEHGVLEGVFRRRASLLVRENGSWNKTKDLFLKLYEIHFEEQMSIKLLNIFQSNSYFFIFKYEKITIAFKNI